MDISKHTVAYAIIRTLNALYINANVAKTAYKHGDLKATKRSLDVASEDAECAQMINTDPESHKDILVEAKVLLDGVPDKITEIADSAKLDDPQTERSLNELIHFADVKLPETAKD